MTDEQIIKALACCQTAYQRRCKECPYEKFQSPSISVISCDSELRKDLLALINHQKAEIELWKEECESVGCENEWLKAYLKNAEAEIIKGLTDKLKNYFGEIMFAHPASQHCEYLDDFIKEMVGDT